MMQPRGIETPNSPSTDEDDVDGPTTNVSYGHRTPRSRIRGPTRPRTRHREDPQGVGSPTAAGPGGILAVGGCRVATNLVSSACSVGSPAMAVFGELPELQIEVGRSRNCVVPTCTDLATDLATD